MLCSISKIVKMCEAAWRQFLHHKRQNSVKRGNNLLEHSRQNRNCLSLFGNKYLKTMLIVEGRLIAGEQTDITE